MVRAAVPKPLKWRGSSKADFQAFPAETQREMGYALYVAQMGGRHETMAKTLAGFGGGGVIEIRDSWAGSAYRAVYTVRLADAVYVLHAFQKKSKTGAATPTPDIRLVRERLKELIAEMERRK
jgi:phage-related protein